MSYRSWLEDVKKINDLGEHLHAISYDTEEDGDRIARKEVKWLEVRQRPIPVAKEYKKIYGCGMHDSQVLGIRRDKSNLYMDLSCDLTYIHAGHLAQMLEIEAPNEIWPITLVLNDVAYATSVRHDPQGHLRWTDWLHPRKYEGATDCDRFISDWFHTQDNRIQWIAEIWAWREKLSKMSSSIYLLVDCTEATAVDHRKEAFTRVFSSAAALIWEDMMNGQTVNGNLLLSPCQAYESLTMCIEARGLHLDDLRPSAV
jgi:hypothetical protein